MLAMKRCALFVLVVFSLSLAGQTNSSQQSPSARLTIQESLAFAPIAKGGTTPKGWITLAGIKTGRDEVLETAIRQILGPGVSEATVEKLAKPDAAPQPLATK